MIDLPRWFTMTDGTLSFTSSIYDQTTLTQTYETIGGATTQRMLNGTAIKQVNWQKLKTTLQGTGGLPLGIADLDFTMPITISCAVARAIVRPTNSFPTIPSHRTDGAYAPAVYKRINGFWIPVSASSPGTPDAYMLRFWPLLTCFFEPLQDSFNFDATLPASWTLTGEEI